MTELTIDFGNGAVRFREETWGGMIALLSQMLDCVQPTGAIDCRIVELEEPLEESSWIERYRAAGEKIEAANNETIQLWAAPIIEEEPKVPPAFSVPTPFCVEEEE